MKRTTTPPSTEASVQYGLAQRIRYEYSGPITNLRQRLMVVPRADHGGQRRLGWHLDVLGVSGADVDARLDRFGNQVVDVVVAHVEEYVEFVVNTTAVVASAPHRMKPDRRFLSPTRLTQPDQAMVDIARPDERQDPRAICERTHAALTYEWGITGVRTTAAEALALGRGVCQDYAHIMLAACRLAGMPARYVSGHMVGEGGSHAWVEVLRPGPPGESKWTVEAWDPTHARRTGTGYVTVAFGRDYSDVPPMSGTFEAGGVATTLQVTKSATAA